MSNVLYAGVDVSKKTLDVAFTADGKQIKATKRVSNDISGYMVLEQWSRAQMQDLGCQETHYVVESTGIYSEALVRYLGTRGDFKVSVINPFQAKSYGKTVAVRTKTDKIDAQLLAFYGANLRPGVMTEMSEELRELRSLVRHLEYLTNRRGQEAGRLESATNSVIRGSINEIIKSYDKQIKDMEKAIESLLKEHPELKEAVELLESITGIGRITSRILLCELHNNPRISAKAETAHAGLAPQHRSSGTSVRGKPHICRTGNRRLRKCLYFPAISAIRHNPLIREFYRRLIERGKPKKVALVAAMRKLLVIAVGVLNNKTPFDANWSRQKLLAPTIDS